ncbi:MAG TPA: hydrogenase expression/formation protein HypE [Bryobacteraceae bacterium]|nr:hydrogenase expression/formation protein HypE [Bryobacteraceae bacterium]
MEKTFALSCPLPITERKSIVMGHGSGGKLTSQLIQDLFLPAFDNEYLKKLDDQAVFRAGSARLAFTTDSFVVTPLFFPGGNIGELAVNGTVNDLAMSGAQPLFLSSAFILEEGFPVDDLSRIIDSMAQAARAAGVAIVTGDTKVVNKGSADKLFVTTSGVGLLPEGVEVSASRACPGDVILLSGFVGDHGMAIMSVREGLEFEGEIRSDTAPLHTLVRAMLDAAPDLRDIHVLRDPTRGGLATSLCEIAAASSTGIEISSSAVPVREDVKGACEILGLDPLFVANEGKLVAFVPEASSEAVLNAMRNNPAGLNAASIGRCVAGHPGMVLLKTEIGGTRILDLPFSEQLPRIC